MTVRKNIIIGQIIFYASMIICFILKPAGLTANNGISYYGTSNLTLAPYIAGILVSSFLIFIATLKYKKIFKSFLIRILLLGLFPLSILLILFPYNISNTFSNIHQAIGVLIFVSQLITSIILAIEAKTIINYKFFNNRINRWDNSGLLFNPNQRLFN